VADWWQRIPGVTFRVCPECKYGQRFEEADWFSCRRCKKRLPHWRWTEIPYIVISTKNK
jgi:hypothetical protein